MVEWTGDDLPMTPASTSRSYVLETISSTALESFVPDPGNLDANSSTSKGSVRTTVAGAPPDPIPYPTWTVGVGKSERCTCKTVT